jgi:hypothetical protein
MAGKRTGDDNARATVEAACCGDMEAVAGLYERYYDMMVGVQEKDDSPGHGSGRCILGTAGRITKSRGMRFPLGVTTDKIRAGEAEHR